MNTELVQSYLDICTIICEHDLVRASSGNLSIRTSPNSMAIKSNGSWMRYIRPENIVECSWDNNGICQETGEIKPSSESRFHALIYQSRPEIGYILHFQSPYATTISTWKDDVSYDVIVEVPYYCRPIATVGLFSPGSLELSDAVCTEAQKGVNVIQMKNHGQIALGDAADIMLRRAIFFELACRTIVLSHNEQSIITAF